MNRRISNVLVSAVLACSIVSPSVHAQTVPAGEQLYKMRCQACHTIAPGAKGVIGPNLSGVVGRKAGSTGFAYSPALKASGVVWTRANLEQYLAGPTKMIPGSRMPVNVADAAQRKAIIAYLTGH